MQNDRKAPEGAPPTLDVGVISEAKTLLASSSSGTDATLVAESGAAPIELDRVTLDDARGRDRYEGKKVLGAGGMGEVRLCRDRRLGREVALKVMHEELAGDRSASARFLREARIQGQLEHPSVVPVYDLAHAEGGLFFTMKRVRGMTLEDVLEGLRRGDADVAARYTVRRLLTAFSSVCLAIDFAHARGVLHRDLKPGNVMLGDFGEVHVLDWGLAKVLGVADEAVADQAPAGVEALGATLHGSLLGTPGYMSPEQALGKIDELDAGTDVYALGAILFEILTLQRMHDGASTPQILASTVTGTCARRLDPGPGVEVAPELAAIYLRATELDRAARLPSARALSDAIERYLDGDRDEARRRELAEAHAARAEEAASKVDEPGARGREARALAMREVGKALALDPSNASALRTLAAMLTTPPREMPPEAEADLAASEARTWRAAAKLAAGRVAVWLVFGVLLFATVGVRLPAMAVVTLGSIAVAGALAWWASTRATPPRKTALAFVAAISLGTGLLSGVFGPLVLVPSLAATNTMFLALNAARRERLVVLAFGLACLLVPVALDVTGVLPPAYSLTTGGVLMRERVGVLNGSALVMLLAISLATIVTTSALVGRVRDALTSAERSLFLQAWQLRQLVPPEASATLSERSPRAR